MKTLPFPTILVTGGANGIGLGIVQALLTQGLAVASIDPDRRANAALTREAEQRGWSTRLLVIAGDITQETVVRRAIAAVVRRFGRLDVLVNNAGIADASAGPVERLSLRRWERYLAVNLTGAFLCVKHAVPALRRARGCIINIASTRALQSEPHTEAYATTKGGMVALTHALAVSLGPDIRVNGISPGWIATAPLVGRQRRTPELRPRDHAQHPVGRVGRPEDIAGAVAYLMSPEAAFITGQTLVIDGGMTRRMLYAE